MEQLEHSSAVGWSDFHLTLWVSAAWDTDMVPTVTHTPSPPRPELVSPLSKVTVCQSNTLQKGQLELAVVVASFLLILKTFKYLVLIFNSSF